MNSNEMNRHKTNIKSAKKDCEISVTSSHLIEMQTQLRHLFNGVSCQLKLFIKPLSCITNYFHVLVVCRVFLFKDYFSFVATKCRKNKGVSLVMNVLKANLKLFYKSFLFEQIV